MSGSATLPEIEFDEDGYPTDGTLAAITAYPVASLADCHALLGAISPHWRWPSYIAYEDGAWRVSTGGWSGHEAIIGALRENRLFWVLAWYSERRGGHYLFEIERKTDGSR